MPDVDGKLDIHKIEGRKDRDGCHLVVTGRVCDDKLWNAMRAGDVMGFSIMSREQAARRYSWWRRALNFLSRCFDRLARLLEC